VDGLCISRNLYVLSDINYKCFEHIHRLPQNFPQNSFWALYMYAFLFRQKVIHISTGIYLLLLYKLTFPSEISNSGQSHAQHTLCLTLSALGAKVLCVTGSLPGTLRVAALCRWERSAVSDNGQV